MAAILEFCSLPVMISNVPAANEETSIYVKCHDRLFSNVTVVDDKDRELFIGSGPGPMKSWSWRRQVKGTSGQPIFDLRHHGWAMKNLWTVESPDGHHIADLKHVSSKGRSDLDMVIANGKGKEDDVVLQIRQKDQSAITTQVFYKNACIADLLLQESNDISDLSQVDRSSWKIRIAGGVDPVIVSSIILNLERMRLTCNLDLGHSPLPSGNASRVETVGCTRHQIWAHDLEISDCEHVATKSKRWAEFTSFSLKSSTASI
jgi:hypothetical protein